MLDKTQELLNTLKRNVHITQIWLWHEETEIKMKMNLFELRRKFENGRCTARND